MFTHRLKVLYLESIFHILGISIVLHFGKDQPREHVSAIVVTVINKLPEAISDYELKAVVPRGCKVKIQDPTTTSLPAHNPFVPASAITQVMLIANPTKKDPVSFKYIVSYSVDGEPQTEMGQVDRLPIWMRSYQVTKETTTKKLILMW